MSTENEIKPSRLKSPCPLRVNKVNTTPDRNEPCDRRQFVVGQIELLKIDERLESAVVDRRQRVVVQR